MIRLARNKTSGGQSEQEVTLCWCGACVHWLTLILLLADRRQPTTIDAQGELMPVVCCWFVVCVYLSIWPDKSTRCLQVTQLNWDVFALRCIHHCNWNKNPMINSRKEVRNSGLRPNSVHRNELCDKRMWHTTNQRSSHGNKVVSNIETTVRKESIHS